MVAIGDPISFKEHIDIIVEGLPEHYYFSIVFITNKIDLPSLSEIEIVLLANESQLEKFHKKNVVSINVVTISSAPPKSNLDTALANLKTTQTNFVQQIQIKILFLIRVSP